LHKLYHGEFYGEFKMDFIFVVKNEPSEEIVKEFHKGMANDLIENYGVETMKEVLRQMKLKTLKEKQAE